MSLISRIIKQGKPSGWSALSVVPEGLVGATVLPPSHLGEKPKVAACSFVSGDFDSDSLSEVASAIGRSGCAWTVPLPHKAYSILVIEEPPVRPEELEESVRWAAGSMIDFPVANAVVSWMRIPTQSQLPNRTPHMYVVAAQKDTVDAYRDVFKSAKLPLQAVDVMENAYRNLSAMLVKPEEGGAFLAIGKRGVQLVITFRGELYLDRYVDEDVLDTGGDQDAVARACERVVLQVQRSLDFVSRTLPFIEISRLVLAPLPHGTPLAASLEGNLPIPVDKMNLSDIFDLSSVPQLRDDESMQARYLPVIGAALRYMDGVA